MQCPYCETKIGFFQKATPCPNCGKELRSKIDYKTFFMMFIPMLIVYIVVRMFLGIDGIYKSLLIGVTVGVTMLPAILLAPKQEPVEEKLTYPKPNLGKSMGIGAGVIVAFGLLFAMMIGMTSPRVNVVVPGDMDKETVKEIMADPEVQKMMKEE